MRTEVTLPYSGELLVSHLAAYGLASVLYDAGIRVTVSHGDSLTFEPQVGFDLDAAGAAEVIRQSAVEAEAAVEADLVPGKSGNARRSLIGARASRDDEEAADVLRRRDDLLLDAEAESRRTVGRILAGIGATAAWGGDQVKPQWGATALDGVLGNHTSDFVRGVLRPARRAAAEVDASTLERLWAGETGDQHDKTGWAPPGTQVDLVHQWLAAIGLGLLPVAHRLWKRSSTPAVWPGGDGVTLPLLEPVTLPRVSALLKLASLPAIREPEPTTATARARGELRSLGINEVVLFRCRRTGSKSSVAFVFERGVRADLRERA